MNEKHSLSICTFALTGSCITTQLCGSILYENLDENRDGDGIIAIHLEEILKQSSRITQSADEKDVNSFKDSLTIFEKEKEGLKVVVKNWQTKIPEEMISSFIEGLDNLSVLANNWIGAVSEEN